MSIEHKDQKTGSGIGTSFSMTTFVHLFCFQVHLHVKKKIKSKDKFAKKNNYGLWKDVIDK